MLFELGFYLKNPRDRTLIVYVTSKDNAMLARNKHCVLLFVDVNVITFLAE